MVQKSGGNAPVEVGSLAHYVQGFIDPRWFFGISSINNMNEIYYYINNKVAMCLILRNEQLAPAKKPSQRETCPFQLPFIGCYIRFTEGITL